MSFYIDPQLADMAIPARRAWGRGILITAWGMVYPGETPNLASLQIMHGMTELEGWYGFAGHPSGWKGSHNWGGVTCSHGPPCDGNDCFQSGDHDANGNPYQTCFKAYASPEDGAADMIHIANDVHGGREPSLVGDLMAFCIALRTPPVYYVGDSPDITLAATHRASAMYTIAQSVANDLGEDCHVSLTGPADDPGAVNPIASTSTVLQPSAWLRWLESVYARIKNAF